MTLLTQTEPPRYPLGKCRICGHGEMAHCVARADPGDEHQQYGWKVWCFRCQAAQEPNGLRETDQPDFPYHAYDGEVTR